MAKYRSDFVLTNDTRYLAHTGEKWGAFREFFKENDQDISKAHCFWFMIKVTSLTNWLASTRADLISSLAEETDVCRAARLAVGNIAAWN